MKYSAFLYGVINLLRKLLPESRFQALHRRLLVAQGVRLADDVIIYTSVKVSRTINLFIDSNSFIGSSCVFTGGEGSTVSIGSECDVSDHVHFVTGTHEINNVGIRRAGRGLSRDISVGDGVWIGYRSLILPGVKIGRGAIIAAGSVVAGDVPEDVLAGGVPCRPIKKLGPAEGT
jgi:acetyltransferase-like isoleucine patch superfamily enzyme